MREWKTLERILDEELTLIKRGNDVFRNMLLLSSSSRI